MICHLCKKYFIDEDSFIGIFRFSELCNHCKDKYHPKLQYEVIPIQLGYIHYFYLFEEMGMNIHYEQYLSKHLEIIYILIQSKRNEYDIFIYFDDLMDHQYQELNELIKQFKYIFLFTLSRKELIYKYIF